MKNIYSLLLVTFCLFSCTDSKKMELELTSDQLESAVGQGFPYSHDEGLVKVVVEQPNIELEDGRIHLNFPIDTRGLIKKKGNVLVSGIINYDKNNRSLYVDEGRVDEILFDKRNEIDTKYKKKYTKMANSAVQKYLNGTPVYTFDSVGVGSFTSQFLKSIRTENDKLIVEMGL